MTNLAVLYRRQGKYGQAESLNIRVVEVKLRILGKEHPDTLISMNNLATLYQAGSDFARAEGLW
jgi:hypothetical protein